MALVTADTIAAHADTERKALRATVARLQDQRRERIFTHALSGFFARKPDLFWTMNEATMHESLDRLLDVVDIAIKKLDATKTDPS